MTTPLSKLPLISPSTHIVFFTGAGMSAESGVPTYRGKGGVWHEYRYQDYACQQAFENNPKKVWDFNNTRREAVWACQPHAGHNLIRELQEQCCVTIITQNIDGMHQRAGAKSVIELHGSMWRIRHPKTQQSKENWDIPFTQAHIENNLYWRPDIVWFGDMLCPKTLAQAHEAIKDCDILISIGTSASVYPAAELPLWAKNSSREKPPALCLEMNPEQTPMTSWYDEHISLSASQGLFALFNAIHEQKSS